MAKKEIVTLSGDGEISQEFSGYTDKTCFKVAADVARELEALGVVTRLEDVRIKDFGATGGVVDQQTQKVEQGG